MAIFDTSAHHDNGWAVVLPYHAPEVFYAITQWPLGGNVLMTAVKALRENKMKVKHVKLKAYSLISNRGHSQNC